MRIKENDSYVKAEFNGSTDKVKADKPTVTAPVHVWMTAKDYQARRGGLK